MPVDSELFHLKGIFLQQPFPGWEDNDGMVIEVDDLLVVEGDDPAMCKIQGGEAGRKTNQFALTGAGIGQVGADIDGMDLFLDLDDEIHFLILLPIVDLMGQAAKVEEDNILQDGSCIAGQTDGPFQGMVEDIKFSGISLTHLQIACKKRDEKDGVCIFEEIDTGIQEVLGDGLSLTFHVLIDGHDG